MKSPKNLEVRKSFEYNLGSKKCWWVKTLVSNKFF